MSFSVLRVLRNVKTCTCDKTIRPVMLSKIGFRPTNAFLKRKHGKRRTFRLPLLSKMGSRPQTTPSLTALMLDTCPQNACCGGRKVRRIAMLALQDSSTPLPRRLLHQQQASSPPFVTIKEFLVYSSVIIPPLARPVEMSFSVLRVLRNVKTCTCDKTIRPVMLSKIGFRPTNAFLKRKHGKRRTFRLPLLSKMGSRPQTTPSLTALMLDTCPQNACCSRK